jgi:hypothetical protein
MKGEHVLTDTEKLIFKIGLATGVRRYAWWQDGQQYVGTASRTLSMALDEIIREEPPNTLLMGV